MKSLWIHIHISHYDSLLPRQLELLCPLWMCISEIDLSRWSSIQQGHLFPDRLTYSTCSSRWWCLKDRKDESINLGEIPINTMSSENHIVVVHYFMFNPTAKLQFGTEDLSEIILWHGNVKLLGLEKYRWNMIVYWPVVDLFMQARRLTGLIFSGWKVFWCIFWISTFISLSFL